MKRLFAVCLVLVLFVSTACADDLLSQAKQFEWKFNGFADLFGLPNLPKGSVSGENVIYRFDDCTVAYAPSGSDDFKIVGILFNKPDVPELYAWMNCLYVSATGGNPDGQTMHLVYMGYILNGKGWLPTQDYYLSLTMSDDGNPYFAIVNTKKQ